MSLTVKQYAVGTSAFVAITATVEVNYFSLMSNDGHDVLLRTDPNDATTEWSLPAGAVEVVNAGPWRKAFPWRWHTNDILLWAKAVSGATTMVLKQL